MTAAWPIPDVRTSDPTAGIARDVASPIGLLILAKNTN
jgi:hypothetical protein